MEVRSTANSYGVVASCRVLGQAPDKACLLRPKFQSTRCQNCPRLTDEETKAREASELSDLEPGLAPLSRLPGRCEDRKLHGAGLASVEECMLGPRPGA